MYASRHNALMLLLVWRACW